MKSKTIIIAFCFVTIGTVVLGLKRELDQPKYMVRHTLPEWQNIDRSLEEIQVKIDSSNLPHQEVKEVLQSIQNIRIDIAQQVGPQISKDTTSHKK